MLPSGPDRGINLTFAVVADAHTRLAQAYHVFALAHSIESLQLGLIDALLVL